LSLGEELVTVFDDLMSAAYQIHIMLLQESGNDIGPKGEGDTSVVLAPTCDIFIWVRPEEIAEKTAVGDLVRKLASAHAIPMKDHKSLAKYRKHTSVGRMTRRICSMEFRSGLKPPCIVNIFSSIIAAIGKQLKQSVKVFHSLILYLLLHSS